MPAGEERTAASSKGRSYAPAYSEIGQGNRDLFLGFRNTVLVYCEDAGWEEFYERLLRRLGLAFDIEDVFCVGGKGELKKRRREKSEKMRIFLFDKDFDDLIGSVTSGKDVVYLTRYSVENFFIEEDLFVAYVLDQKKGLRRKDVVKRLAFGNRLAKFTSTYEWLCRYFVLSEKFRLGVAGPKLDIGNFCDCDGAFNADWCGAYENEMRAQLAQKQAWLLEGDRLKSELASILEPTEDYSSIADGTPCCHFPGKHLFEFLMSACGEEFGIDAEDCRYSFMMVSADRIDLERFRQTADRMTSSLVAQAA